MITIEHDIEQITKKIESIFENYPEADTDDLIRTLENALDDSGVVNTHVQYMRYLSHAYGRKRCFRMRNMTRKDLFKAYYFHLDGQNSAYNDLITLFRSLGGVFE